MARLLQKHLTRQGFEVTLAGNGTEGLQQLMRRSFDMVLIDYWMPDMTGLEMLAEMQHALADPPPAVIVTASGTEAVAVEAMKQGAADYLIKDSMHEYLHTMPERITELTERRRLLKAKQAAEAEKEKMILELNAFAHTVAHDLKNPVFSLKGIASILMQDDAVLPSHQRFVQAVSDISDRMGQIIEDLLLLACVGGQQVQLSRVSLADSLAAALNRVQFQIEQSGAVIETGADLPEVWGYAGWIEEVWVNYITNAIKYSHRPPQIRLGATLLPDGRVRAWVRDNGPGIRPEDQQKLFTPFTRLDRSKANGHGLGLSIVQRIIEKLNGSVGVDSTPGEGSEFFFILPAPAAQVRSERPFQTAAVAA